VSNQIIRAVCPHDCPDTCAMLVEVDESGRAVRVRGDPEHPFTHGGLCVKVAHYQKRTYHRERLLYPMKRAGHKGEGKFVRISWDEALETIAPRLKAIAQKNPQSNDDADFRVWDSQCWFPPLELAALAAAGVLPANAPVLDVGCGAGMDLLLAAKSTGPRGRAIGVDMTSAMAERAMTSARARICC